MIYISVVCTRSLPFMPVHLDSTIVCQHIYEPVKPLNSVLADLLTCRSARARFAKNLSNVICGAMRTSSFGDGFNNISLSLCNHFGRARMCSFCFAAQSKCALFAGIISRAQGGPHDRRGTAISRSESPQCPGSQLARIPWRLGVGGRRGSSRRAA